MNYNELKTLAHDNAVKHGFWRIEPTWEHCMMLVITEVSEMVEADRKGRNANVTLYRNLVGEFAPEEAVQLFKDKIKDTVEDEMADVAIRLFDLAGGVEVDFDKLQKPRYFHSFDKFTFAENAFALVRGLTRGTVNVNKRIVWGLQYLEMWAEYMGVNLGWHVSEKMKYNAGRDAMHGKKY